MSFLELHKVTKVYGAGHTEVDALRDVDLAVEAGSLVAVMGSSGSGKTTLLTIAGSLEEPTAGEVVVGGTSLRSMSRNQKARLRRQTIGYVFQDFNLLAGLTAAENVSLPLELDGTPARKARVTAMAALDELGLAERGQNFPDELSGGERQRVAIARAVVGERSLLLADEPSGALDSTNGEAVMRLVLAACRRGVAAVVVTHDAQLASWADRGLLARWARRGPDHASRRTRVPPRSHVIDMTTVALDRPTEVASSGSKGRGGVPARRAMVRWAWRLFRREWRQQLLIVTLITVAVAATIIGAAVAVNTPPPKNAGFGTANHMITIPGRFLRSSPHIVLWQTFPEDHTALHSAPGQSPTAGRS